MLSVLHQNVVFHVESSYFYGIMRKLFILTVSLLIAAFQLNAQEGPYTQSGYTSLTIKLSGDYPKTMDISTPHSANPLSQEKPGQFQIIDDSTLVFSFFTFGPSPVYFIFNNRYLSSVLLPNQSDVLQIHYADTAHYTMDYQGYFKEIFDHSHLQEEMIRRSFDYGHGPAEKMGIAGTFKSANGFRDARLERIGKMTAELSSDIESPALKQYCSEEIEGLFKSFLLEDYENAVILHNRNIGLDSLDALRYIPTRDRSYYDGIIDRKYADTVSLMPASYYRFLNSLRKDPLLNLPPVSSAGPDVYRNS